VYPAAAIPSIFQNGNTMLSSLTGTAYQWYFNGSAVSGANAQSFTTFYAGSYEVEVTDANGCVGRSAPYAFTPNGISGVSGTSWKIYPNPTKGIVTMEGLTGNSSDLILVDMQGRQVGRWTVSGDKTQLNLSGVPAGMYVLKVVSTNSADLVRLIVE
jgi:hypothetical protein